MEHLLSLRAIPDLVVIRPADATETAGAWAAALERTAGPTAIVRSRQGLPVLEGSTVDGVSRGAYVVAGAEAEEPGLVLIATGSEVALAVAAGRELALSGIRTRVVSMPSWELFREQPAEYRQVEGYRRSLLPPGCPRLAVEAGVSRGWREYVGDTGDVVALDRFGASAPGKVVAEKLGLTVATVVERARRLLSHE